MLLALVTLCGCDSDNRFESARWRQENPGNDDRWPYRADMVKDLVENHNFRGWERSSLVALLGPPDEPNWLSTGDAGYLIGEAGMGYEYLIFKIDSSDKVKNYEVVYVGF